MLKVKSQRQRKLPAIIYPGFNDPVDTTIATKYCRFKRQLKKIKSRFFELEFIVRMNSFIYSQAQNTNTNLKQQQARLSNYSNKTQGTELFTDNNYNSDKDEDKDIDKTHPKFYQGITVKIASLLIIGFILLFGMMNFDTESKMQSASYHLLSTPLELFQTAGRNYTGDGTSREGNELRRLNQKDYLKITEHIAPNLDYRSYDIRGMKGWEQQSLLDDLYFKGINQEYGIHLHVGFNGKPFALWIGKCNAQKEPVEEGFMRMISKQEYFGPHPPKIGTYWQNGDNTRWEKVTGTKWRGMRNEWTAVTQHEYEVEKQKILDKMKKEIVGF